MFFREIKATRHFVEEHEHKFPLHEVAEVIVSTKNQRKKGDCIEIEDDRHYILFKKEKDVIWVINAKRK